MCSFQKLRISHKCERSTTKDSCPASSVILSTYAGDLSLCSHAFPVARFCLNFPLFAAPLFII